MIALALAQLFLPEMPPWCRESSDSVVSRLLNSLIACQDVPGCQGPYLLSKQDGRLYGSSSYNQILFWRLCGFECGLWAPVNCVAIVIVDGAFFDHDKQHTGHCPQYPPDIFRVYKQYTRNIPRTYPALLWVYSRLI